MNQFLLFLVVLLYGAPALAAITAVVTLYVKPELRSEHFERLLNADDDPEDHTVDRFIILGIFVVLSLVPVLNYFLYRHLWKAGFKHSRRI